VKRKSFLGLAAGLAILPKSWSESNHLLYDNESFEQLPWDTLRSLFPLKTDRTFLNNGTMGITPYPVINAIQKSLTDIAENAAYPRHDHELEKKLAELIGCDHKEIGITKNVSEGVNHIAWGIPLKRGDEVIMTTHEHVGGCAAWLQRARLEGIVIKTIPIDPSNEQILQRLADNINSKTKVIAVPHIPCTIGQVLPVKEICTLAREKGIISCIDGAHPLGMLELDLKDIGCDYYAGCFHKWMLGPIGSGWVYMKQERLKETKTTHVAAYSVNAFNMSKNPPFLDDVIEEASRYSYGTFNGPQQKGCVAALELYKKIGPQRIESRVKELGKYVQTKLLELNDRIELLTPTDDHARGGQNGFRILKSNKKHEKINSEFVQFARKNGVILRYVGENDIDCIRVSTHYYNNESDVDQMMNLLNEYMG